jgi:thiol:disulfide interchange protein DsbA
MEARRLWLLAALLAVGCGSNEPPTEQTAADEPPVAIEDTDPSTEPQNAAVAATPGAALVGSDSAGAPTAGRFVLGTHYTRLSPTQPTSSNPDQVEVAEIFWYGCPHCFDFDAYLKPWEARKGE